MEMLGECLELEEGHTGWSGVGGCRRAARWERSHVGRAAMKDNKSEEKSIDIDQQSVVEQTRGQEK